MLGELCGCPGNGRMAAAAILAKLSGMDIWLAVAGFTHLGCTGKQVIGMALNAADCFMPFLQDINSVVFECYDSPGTIVTIQTVFTMFSAVLGDKFAVGIFMAGQTAYFIAGKTALCVAIFTNHLRRIKTNLVPGQAKAAQRLMIDIAERYFADDNLTASVFNMAALALFGTR